MAEPSIERQFIWASWANKQLLVFLNSVAERPPRSIAILSHILAAEQLWLDRLLKRPQSMAVWPELSMTEITALIGRIDEQWRAYLGEPSHLAEDQPVQYINTKGESFRDRPSEIITHVLLHGAYHRGQIALLLRQAGVTPPLTDYIHAVRTGAIDRS